MDARNEFDSIDALFDAGHSPHAALLLQRKAASRIAAHDAGVFGVSDEDAAHARRFMGWTDLCTNPPADPDDIMGFAGQVRAQGLSDVVLIGQGGSSQAPMTMAAMLAAHGMTDIGFHTMDCLSPRAFRAIMDAIDPARTMFVVSSKSGSTIEPNSLFACAWQQVAQRLGEHDRGRRFVAITDPGSSLEQLAQQRGFARVFHGQPQVGGRFSALSVFGLVPFALMGVDVRALLADCAVVQRACWQDDPENPALRIAAFLSDAWADGRDKISFSFSESTRSFGLWLEQLIAESLGKHGTGILPSTEPATGLLSTPRPDRCAIVYALAQAFAPDEAAGAAERQQAIDASIPTLRLEVSEPLALARHFVVWEHATALLGVVLNVNPFDQPDVESTKRAVREFLAAGQDGRAADPQRASFGISTALADELGVRHVSSFGEALELFAGAIEQGGYGCINAFLPECDTAVMLLLENLRRALAHETGCPLCLEMGPRYLHSIGQFQKGGPDTGCLLILSTSEADDIAVPGQPYTLAQLAATQARGDFAALEQAGRRAIRVHLTAPEWCQLAQAMAG